MYGGDLDSIIYELNISDHIPRFDNIVRDHLEVQAVLHPQPVHQFEQLQDKGILPEVVTILEHNFDLAAFISSHTDHGDTDGVTSPNRVHCRVS